MTIPADAVFHSRGTGQVVLIEFADYECPFCARHAMTTAPASQEQFVDGGGVQHAFFNFPLPLHSMARKASEAAECAGRQGRFWEMHDALFDGSRSLAADALLARAERIGVDRERFQACLDDGQAADAVESQMNEGRRLGVNGTPAFFVGVRKPNGDVLVMKRIQGAAPIETFRQAIAEVRQLKAQADARGPVDGE